MGKQREGQWWGREEGGAVRVTFAALAVAWQIGGRTVTPCTWWLCTAGAAKWDLRGSTTGRLGS